jgi:hypothetical protein
MSIFSIRRPGLALLISTLVAGWVIGTAASAEKAGEAPCLDRHSAEQLHEQLLRVSEIGVGNHTDVLNDLRKELAKRPEAKDRAAAPAALALQTRAWQTLGLTCRPESDRLLFRHEAEHLQTNARLFRIQRVVSLPSGESLSKPDVITLDSLRTVVKVSADQPLPHHLTPALNHMLQSENDATRALLVAAMSGIDTNYSTCCLAERAVFDLSPTVRAAAVQALVQRPREEFRPTLLDAFRHPWEPAAQHAAEALVALRDRDALPALTQLLEQRDPLAPFTPPGKDAKPQVRELVRVNHLRNCLLCHAPSQSREDLVVAPVPPPDKPLSVVYYGSPRPTIPEPGDIFVRADITYLRQDFAVMQKVERAKPWPELQRFDFLVRTREAKPEEVNAPARPPAAQVWRQAVVYAIAELRK